MLPVRLHPNTLISPDNQRISEWCRVSRRSICRRLQPVFAFSTCLLFAGTCSGNRCGLQQDGKNRAVTATASNAKASLMPLDDLVSNPQSQPGSDGFLRGKEWFKNSLQIFCRDTFTGISKRQAHPTVAVPPRTVCPDSNVAT